MIKLYLRKKDADSADIVDRLRELVVAHTIVYRDEQSGTRGLEDRKSPEYPRGPENLTPPTLVDDDAVVRGKREILTYLEMLEHFTREWSKFQSDACYCDANGNVE